VQLKGLHVLELTETSLTAMGVESLSAMRGLRQLYVGGVDISPEQAEHLRESLPDCFVSWWRKPSIPSPDQRRGD
jgi:hypothetical protein